MKNFYLHHQFGAFFVDEYFGLGAHAVRLLGNRLAIIQNTRNLTKVKPANTPQSGFGLDIGFLKT